MALSPARLKSRVHPRKMFNWAYCQLREDGGTEFDSPKSWSSGSSRDGKRYMPVPVSTVVAQISSAYGQQGALPNLLLIVSSGLFSFSSALTMLKKNRDTKPTAD